MSECTEERFFKDTESHSMKVIRDDGVHRHLSFSDNGSCFYKFDLITWPGSLCITGDCGTYVFSRLEDMFNFFRMKKNDFNYSEKRKLNINTGYWGEKLQAIDVNGGYMEFSEDTFKNVLINDVNEYWEFDSEEEKAEVLEQLEDEVFSRMEGDESHDYRLADDFKSDKGHQFIDLWDHSFKEYTFRYTWCLYAIVHGISVYDQSKLEKAA